MIKRHSQAPVVCFSALLLTAGAIFTYAVVAAAHGADNVPIRPGETIDGLRMEARALLVEDRNGDKLLMIRAYMINEGSNEATVLTKELETSISRDAEGPVVGFNFTGRQEYEGRLIIPSLGPHEPVALRTQEVAMLAARHTSNRFVESLTKGEKIRVGYLVTDDWGERFELWHGYVCVEVSVEVPPSE